MTRLPLVADAGHTHLWPTAGRLLLACNQALEFDSASADGTQAVATVAECAAWLAVAHRCRHQLIASATAGRRQRLRRIDTVASSRVVYDQTPAKSERVVAG